MKFVLQAPFKPQGDQPKAIRQLTTGIRSGIQYQTLLGITGSGKTFTIANVIVKIQKPVLVISHNKTLAAQLYSEFKQFFPQNAVEYFVSYYDYYQPEAYMPQTDTYIEKDASINEELERLRLSTTSSLLYRNDTIVVASVSCIYGIGNPNDYRELTFEISCGQKITRRELLSSLVSMQYERNNIVFQRGFFRVRGAVIDVFPSYEKKAVRIEINDDSIEHLSIIDPITGKREQTLEVLRIFPAKHFVVPYERLINSIKDIEKELNEHVCLLKKQGKELEANRIQMRTCYDLEMMQSVGYCSGIENYSRFLSGRNAGERPHVLLDFFLKDFIVIIDESHVTIPQIRGMYNADQARKKILIEHGFRLPSALDNRPLLFDEFNSLVQQAIYVSATPREYELEHSGKPVEQIIRPTGLLDPGICIVKTKNQVDDLINRIKKRVQKQERVLVTTLTKRTAEDLAQFFEQVGIRVRYIHSEINAIQRVEILKGLREGEFDVLVGINLLREGLDLPEVSLVAILDADKQGFLRSATSLIQTIGRAARNQNAQVVMYADTKTKAMKEAINETNRRRQIQIDYNKKHNITPTTVQRAVQEHLHKQQEANNVVSGIIKEKGYDYKIQDAIQIMQKDMEDAARVLDFETAALLRDKLYDLEQKQEGRKKREDKKKGIKLRSRYRR